MVSEESFQWALKNERLLRVARGHLDQIGGSPGGATPEDALLKVDHAIVATVFCAAFVEARLTLFLCAPALLMEEEGPRRFVGRLLTRYVLRLPASRKLQCLREQVPTLKSNPIIAKLDDLFSRRNKSLHTSYTYSEVQMFHDQVYDPTFHGTVDASELVLRDRLEGVGPDGNSINDAQADYETAVAFMRLMFEVKPYEPWPPDWLRRGARAMGRPIDP